MKNKFVLFMLGLVLASTTAYGVAINGQLGGARLENLASDPTGTIGRLYFNTGNSTPKYYNGSSWLGLAPLASPTFTGTVTGTFSGNLTGNASGTAANVTGTVAIGNGGTGATSAQTAINALAGAVTSTQYLRGNGTNVVMSAIQATDVPTLNQNTTGTASNVTGTVAIGNGGTGQTSAANGFNALAPATAKGGLIAATGTNAYGNIAAGSNGNVLVSDSASATGLSWTPASSGLDNAVANPSAASDASGWTLTNGSGTATFTRDTTAGTQINGVASFAFNAASSADYVETAALTLKNEITGNCEVSASIYGDATLYTLNLMSGSTVLQSLTGINSASAYKKYLFNYPCGGAGVYKVRIAAAGNGAAINFGVVRWGSSTDLTTGSKTPTIQKFTSGSGTYTTPSGVKFIRVRMVGGGGGGSGGGATSSMGAGSGGGATTLGSSLLSAGGGAAGTANGANGLGGTSSLGTGPLGLALPGGSGSQTTYSNGAQIAPSGGIGGSSALGGAGYGGRGNGPDAGGAGQTNTGGGGGGGGTGNGVVGFGGGGGGSGGYVDAIIENPSATYSYAVGTGGGAGTAGTSGAAGGAGGSGLIIIYEFYDTQTAVRPDQTAQSWSGYHDNTCSWARTNAALGDPTADATCAFTERTNSNFGTVTSYVSGSDKLPGIIFTPSKVGNKYLVCAGGSAANSNTGNTITMDLSDTAPVVIDAIPRITGTGGYETSFKMCGVYTSTSTAATTIRIRTSNNANATTVYGNLEWSVVNISQNTPAPLLVGSVTSNSSGLERVERASIASDGTINAQTGTWLTGSAITHTGTGDYTLNIATGIFSATPSCTFTPNGNALRWIAINTESSTAVRISTYNTSVAVADVAFKVICVGPR
jgi:hypothetical protein